MVERGADTGRASLALVAITFNEAANLPRCLESVAGLTDEIVIVDSGSTDATPQIARKAGVRILYRDFDAYGPQKQYALEQARSDWLLCLDADEWLDGSAREAVRALLSSGLTAGGPCGYRLRRSTRYLGRWVRFGPWARERKLRLVRRGHARWDPVAVHESLRMIQGATAVLPGSIRHRPYADLGHQLEKIDRYTDLIAERDAGISRWRAWYGVALEPWLVFLHRYFIELGFLDGRQGLIGCAMVGFDFFLRYAKILSRGEDTG